MIHPIDYKGISGTTVSYTSTTTASGTSSISHSYVIRHDKLVRVDTENPKAKKIRLEAERAALVQYFLQFEYVPPQPPKIAVKSLFKPRRMFSKSGWLPSRVRKRIMQ